MKILVDKIASVTKNIPLQHEVEITKNIPSEEGTIIVAEVLEDKKEYNQLELPSGRFSTLKKGDIIVTEGFVKSATVLLTIVTSIFSFPSLSITTIEFSSFPLLVIVRSLSNIIEIISYCTQIPDIIFLA